MKKADRLGQIKRKKQIQKYLMQKQNNITNDLEAEEERAKRTMR